MLKQFLTAPGSRVAKGVVRDCQTPSFEPVKRWELLSLVRNLRRELGLSRGDLDAFQALLSFLPCRDSQGGSERAVDRTMLLVIYAGNRTILSRTNGMSERALRDHIARLVRAGLVARRESSNGKRFPLRKNREVVDAFGLDLAPAFLAFPRLAEIDRCQQEDREAARSLRSAILARRKDLLGRSAELSDEMRTWLCDLSRLLRRSLSLIELEQIAYRITALEEALPAANEPADQQAMSASDASPVVAPSNVLTDTPRSGVCERAASAAPKRALSRLTQPNPRPFPSGFHTPIYAATDGGICRHNESNQIRIKKKTGDRHRLTAQDIWQECPDIAAFYPQPPETPRDMIGILQLIGSFLGISQGLVAEVMATIGPFETARKLNYLIRRFDAIANPAGYIRTIIQRSAPAQPRSNPA